MMGQRTEERLLQNHTRIKRVVKRVGKGLGNEVYLRDKWRKEKVF